MNNNTLQASDFESEKKFTLTTTNGGKFDATLLLEIEGAGCHVTVINVEKSEDSHYQGVVDTIKKDGEQKHGLEWRGKKICFHERHMISKNTEAPAFK